MVLCKKKKKNICCLHGCFVAIWMYLYCDREPRSLVRQSKCKLYDISNPVIPDVRGVADFGLFVLRRIKEGKLNYSRNILHPRIRLRTYLNKERTRSRTLSDCPIG